jgi:selenocysteine-specific elongation factor
MKRIIVGTAGHIDHGKTALVKALTGVDTDRLKEEQERGITIDLGFADLTLGDVHFGLIDVPGHERFIKNMLAGAHGLDLVLLVIAADEGIMPQTREHFDICRLLSVKSGLIVITKTDLVDEEFLELVEADVVEFVDQTFLDGAPVLRVSARTGAGIAELKKELLRLAVGVRARDDSAAARLPIDRVFTIKGFGTVVTGTLIAGRIRIGDEMELLPSSQRHARVRNIQVHGRTVNEARAGERAAVNLQGLDVDEVARGQAISPAGRFNVSSMLDVRLHVLASASRPLRSRARVRLHLGTAEALARVVLLETTEIAPGRSGFAQVRIETPLPALPGDHFIIRRSSPMATIGGGTVLDPLPKKHRIKDGAATSAWLARLENADETERIGIFVEMAGEAGLVEAEIAARSGAADETIARAVETLIKSRRLIQAGESPRRFVARSAFDELGKQTRQLLKEYHQRAPLEAGMPREELRERIFSRLHPDLFRAVIANAAGRNELIAERDLIRLATHRVELSPQEKAAKDRLSEIFLQSRLNPQTLEEAITDASALSGIDPQRTQRCAQMLINSGDLVRIADLVFHRIALEELKEILRRFKSEHGTKIDIAVFKDLIGVSRKYAIPLLEYLDRQRVTRRAGDVREIL